MIHLRLKGHVSLPTVSRYVLQPAADNASLKPANPPSTLLHQPSFQSSPLSASSPALQVSKLCLERRNRRHCSATTGSEDFISVNGYNSAAQPSEECAAASPLSSLLSQLPLKQMAVWSTVALTVYSLRHFIGIFMGTFVLSVVGNGVVSWAQSPFPATRRNRRITVLCMYAVTVASAVALGFVFLPRFTEDVAEIIYKFQQTEDPYSIASDGLRNALGEQITDQLERFILMTVGGADITVLDVTIAGSREHRLEILRSVLKRYSMQLVSYFAMIVTAVSRFLLQSAVSLILSFMVVWDMASIQTGLKSLQHSRLSIFYSEMAPAVNTFGQIFTKAIQAQSVIAAVNTLLTTLGLLTLNLHGVGPLAAVTFVCSFVPVAGVVLSTLPISLVAISEGGLVKVCFVLAMVVVIHAIEAYILNPAIYSAHLKLHPILTLAVILLAEHALGVWGLLVAVPMAVFVIDYLILNKPMHGSLI